MAETSLKNRDKNTQQRQLILWIGALITGGLLGLINLSWLHEFMNFIATVYTRLFQLLAVPTISLAVITTLVSFGNQKDTGRIFRHTITFTLLTTFAAAFVGLLLYVIVAPGNLPLDVVSKGSSEVPQDLGTLSYLEHILKIIPNNIVQPFLEGNVLSILLLAFAVGIGLAKLPDSDSKKTVTNFLHGLQDLLFLLIRALIWTLPLGIVAFAAQLSAQVNAGIVFDSLGKYAAVILGGNAIQFFVVLPLFLLAKGINPIRTMGCMSPALLMGFFKGSTFCVAYLYYHQYEWLCRLYTCHITFCYAEWRHTTLICKYATVAFHISYLCSW